MTFLSLSSVLAAFMIWLAYYVYELIMTKKRSDMQVLAYPSSPHWLWGHEKEAMYDTTFGEVYSRWLDVKGGVLRMKGALWYGDILVVADPHALFHIESKNVYNYQKTKVFRSFVERFIGKSVAWAEGNEHKRMRSILTPCFTPQKVREMEGAVNQCTENLVNSMRGYVTSQMETGKTSATVNIMEWNSCVALDIIGRVGFCHDFGLGKSPEAQGILRTMDTTLESITTFSGFLMSIVLRAFPFLVLLPSESIRKQAAVRDFIRTVGKELAEAKIARLATGEGLEDENKDLLSYLIKASYKEGQSLDVDELMDHITTFIIAGHETTATALSYAIHTLAHHSDIQAQLRNELLNFGREPTFDDLHNKHILKVLDAVTKESMRLFPVGAYSERMAVMDDVIPLHTAVQASDGTLLNSITIRKGQMIYIPRLSINTRPGAWGPDGQAFVPSRWLEVEDSGNEKTSFTPPQVSVSGWNNLNTFSEGARMCLGYRLAVLEFKAIIAALIKAFVFEEVPGFQFKNRLFGALLTPTMVPSAPGTTEASMIEVHCLPVKVSLVDQH